MVGSTCLVQGVRPILFARHMPRIGIFCLTHKCCHVLLPAGSIRSSSLVSRYEDCFKPTALHFPGSPLRPSGSASVLLGPCRSTCWCKTGRNCISQLQTGLPLWGPLHLSLMGLLKCQFWDGGGRCTLPSWDTKLWCIQNQAEISRLKIKFGDLPESEAAWNKNPHRAENFHSVPASLVNLVPTERGPSKRGLGGSYNFGNTKWRWATERWFQDTCFHGKHVGLLALFEENNGVGRSFTWPVQIRWYWRWPLNWREQTCRAVSHWKYLTGLGLPLIFQLVGRVNWKHGLWMLVLTYPHHIQKSVKSSPILILLIQPWDRLNVTTLKDTKICWKPFSASISTSCSDFLHRHKTEPRPERHRL